MIVIIRTEPGNKDILTDEVPSIADIFAFLRSRNSVFADTVRDIAKLWLSSETRSLRLRLQDGSSITLVKRNDEHS